MKIAVVHDYFTQLGGAEKVAEELYRLFPQADLFATVALPSMMPPLLRNVAVQTTWMQKMPWLKSFYRFYFLLYPLAVCSLDLSAYDLVLSSSSGYAKGIRTRPDAMHVCYCHTPMRWAWSYNSYASREAFGAVERFLLPTLTRALRFWDLGASRQPDHFVANSRIVAERIQLSYGRTAEVIHPPIEVERFHSVAEQGSYYLVLARLAPYKRMDLAIKACTALGAELIVIGEGTDRKQLESMAGPTVRFLGRASDDEVNHHVSRCKALLFPGEEDFGMAPVELAAAGRPTIAYRAGGATESIVDGVTGLFFDEQTVESVIDAIKRFESMKWDKSVLRRHAESFSREVFQARLRSFLLRIGVPLSAESQVNALTSKPEILATSTRVREVNGLHGVAAASVTRQLKTPPI